MKRILVRALSVGIAATLAVGGAVLGSAPANAAQAKADVFIAAAVFYVRVEVNTPACRFAGNGGGLFLSGPGILTGTLDDFGDYGGLLRNTKSFQVTATALAVYVSFFDSSSKQLGQVMVGGIGSVTGIGGGTGSWSCDFPLR